MSTLVRVGWILLFPRAPRLGPVGGLVLCEPGLLDGCNLRGVEGAETGYGSSEAGHCAVAVDMVAREVAR